MKRLLPTSLAALLLLGSGGAHAGPAKGNGNNKSKQSSPKGKPGKKQAQKAPKKDNLPDESGTTAPRVCPNPADPREQRISQLRQRLDEVMAERPLARTRIGVTVVNAADGDVLYARNGDKLFNPASNTKILTTAAALEKLGGDYRYVTALVGDPPDEHGVVHGDVELRGAGDPSLTTAGISDLARDAAARGVTRIEGNIVADGKFRDPQHPFDPQGGGALIINRNVYNIRVRPTENKKPPAINIDPASPEIFTLDNKATTVKGRKTRLLVDVSRRADGRFTVTVKGRINPKAGETKIKRRMGDGALYAAATLRRALSDYNIELTGGIKGGGLAGDAPVIAQHRSSPLAEICRVSNKDSNNFVADAIFKTLGHEQYGGAGTLAKGARAVGELLESVGIAAAKFKIVNGSGLTHENRIEPLSLTHLLRHLYFDLSVAPEFLASLAVGGVDGTIKHRFRGEMIGRVRAKTGTLSNVSALSGYVGDRGDVLIFSILIDNFHHRTLEDIRIAQVRLVREMMGFVKSGGGPQPPTKIFSLPAKTPFDEETEEVEDGESDSDIESDVGGN